MKRFATVLLLVLAACTHGGGSGSPLLQTKPAATTPPPSAAPSTPPLPAPSTGSTARIFTRTYVPDSALIKTVDTPPSSSWNVERAFPGFHFSRPVFLANAGDGSGRVFVVEL